MADAFQLCAVSRRAGRSFFYTVRDRMLEPCFRITECRNAGSAALGGEYVCKHRGQGAIQEMGSSAKRFHLGARRQSFALLPPTVLFPGMAYLVRLFSFRAWLPVGVDHLLLSPADVLFSDHS